MVMVGRVSACRVVREMRQRRLRLGRPASPVVIRGTQLLLPQVGRPLKSVDIRMIALVLLEETWVGRSLARDDAANLPARGCCRSQIARATVRSDPRIAATQ